MNSTINVFLGNQHFAVSPSTYSIVVVVVFLFSYIITYAHVCSCEQLIYTTN